jgi:hypothetical protein
VREVVIGLVSGLLGAGLSSWVAWTLGVRTLRQNAEHAETLRAERERAARDERERDAQVMARVLLADTVLARVRLRSADRSGLFWSAPFAPSLAAWETHKSDVARQMPLEDWDAVSAWFRKMATLEAYAVVARASAPDANQPPVGRNARFVLRDALKLSATAAAALEKFTGKRFEDDALTDDDSA